MNSEEISIKSIQDDLTNYTDTIQHIYKEIFERVIKRCLYDNIELYSYNELIKGYYHIIHHIENDYLFVLSENYFEHKYPNVNLKEKFPILNTARFEFVRYKDTNGTIFLYPCANHKELKELNINDIEIISIKYIKKCVYDFFSEVEMKYYYKNSNVIKTEKILLPTKLCI